MKTIFLLIFLLNTASASSGIFKKIFNSIKSKNYKKTSMILDERKDEIKITDEFGDEVSVYYEIKKLVRKIKTAQAYCGVITSNTDKSLHHIKELRDNLKTDCTQSGELGKLFKEVKNKYRYSALYDDLKAFNKLVKKLDKQIINMERHHKKKAAKQQLATKSKSKGYDKLKEKYKSMGCKTISDYKISQKLDTNTFQLNILLSSMPGKCLKYRRHRCAKRGTARKEYESGLLISSNSKIKGPGYFGWLSVKKTGTKNITLKNGFSKKVSIYTENEICRNQYQKILDYYRN